MTLVVIAVYPRSYASEAKLFLRVGRESVGLDPTATTGETIMLQKSQVDEVNSALNILNSREVLQRVAERVGIERVLDDLPDGDSYPGTAESASGYFHQAATSISAWLDSALKTLRLSDPGTDLDLAIRRLEKGVRVWAPKQSTVISISYSAASPQLAHDVVAATTQVFLEEHLRLSRTDGSFAFFTAQADNLFKELSAAQEELRDRKNSFQLASSESRRAILEAQIQSVEQERLQTERDLAFSEAKIVDLKQAIAGLKPELVTNRVAGFANQARDGMRQKLYELQLKESELSVGYTDEYPPLAQIRKQRKEAEEILASLPNDRTQTTEALNPNERQLDLELLQTKSNGEALRGRQKAAQGQHDKLFAELLTLNDQELQLSQLERNVALLDGKYRMHVEKLEEARINEEMGRDKIQNIKVAQPATLVSKPVWPNKRLIFALGSIIAIGGALGWVFAAESLDQTLRTPDQVEAQIGLPVLATLPYRKSKRRRRPASVTAESAAGESNGQQNGHHAANGQNGHAQSGRYRALVRALTSNGSNGDRHAKTIGVVGCGTSKLRSRVAAGLAMQAASSGGDPVLLIDADARRRRVARRFQVSDLPGWREVSTGAADAASCIRRTNGSNLAVMSPGGTNGHATAGPSHGFVGQLDEIRSEFGLVVVDLPPARELDGPPAGAEWLDEMVLVVEAEQTRIQAAQQAKAVLERAGVHVKGVVLANRREHIPRWLYQRL
ncbi:MAG: hypothetical protein WD669_02515 [Pirellulales bacterium]